MRNIPLEFVTLGILDSANDDEISPASVREDEFGGSYVHDPLDKLLADAQLSSLLGPGRSGPEKSGPKRGQNLSSEARREKRRRNNLPIRHDRYSGTARRHCRQNLH